MAEAATRLDFADTVAVIKAARIPQDLFGADGDLTAARRRYRVLARSVYPDLVAETDHPAAGVATRRLNQMWEQYQKNLTGGFEITTRLHTYRVEPAMRSDEIGVHYPCSWEHDGQPQYGVLRLPGHTVNNDLIEAETRALKTLAEAEPEGFRPYAPMLVEAFRHRDADTGTMRQAVITQRIAGFYTLAEIHDAYPQGLDQYHIGWMWRWILAGMGWYHRAGLVHGAIVPDNILIPPLAHGAVFVNWAYSTPIGGRVPALIGRYRDWYPPEVLNKQPASEATDIYMLAKCMMYLLGDEAPTQLKAFARSCTALRPTDAWAVKNDWETLRASLYGKPHYHPLEMPT